MEAAQIGILARLYRLPRFNYGSYQLFINRAYALVQLRARTDPPRPTRRQDGVLVARGEIER